MSFFSQNELLRDETYWTTKIQLELFREIEDHLQRHSISRSEFAKQLGVSKGYVSQILNGSFDHKLSKLVKLCLAIDVIPNVRFENIDAAIERERQGSTTIKSTYKVGNRKKGSYQMAEKIAKTSTIIHPLAA